MSLHVNPVYYRLLRIVLSQLRFYGKYTARTRISADVSAVLIETSSSSTHCGSWKVITIIL